MALVTSTSLAVVCTAQLPQWHHLISDTDSLVSRVHRIRPINVVRMASPPVCQIPKHTDSPSEIPESKKWQRCLTAALATMVIGTGMTAEADLNKYEAETRGEFGIGSAAQFGSADLRKTVHSNENFRRANFTSADMRESDFSGSTFNGAYLEKAVAYRTNFTGYPKDCAIQTAGQR